MRLLYVISHLENCGPVNVLENIIRELSKTHECTVLTLSEEENNSKMSIFNNYNIDIITLNLKRFDNKKVYLRKLNNVINKQEPNVIHTHGFRSDYYISILQRNNEFKHVTTLHNFPFYDYPKIYGYFRGLLLSFTHMMVLRKIQNKIACSFSIRDKFKKIGFSDIDVIQNGVDISKFRNDEEKKLMFRHKLGFEKNKIIIASVGALIKRKRPIKLLDVIKNHRWDEKVIFVFLGDGELFDKAKKYETENLRIVGVVDNVNEYLKASDIFISNSKAEGLPMAMLEAAATGLIIVGSAIEPHIEVANNYLGKAFFYNSQKDSEITNKINCAIELKDSYKLSDNYSDKLSSCKMANSYLEYYIELR